MTENQASHTLGKYRLIAELGRGGMAEVYLAVAAGPAGFNKLLVLKCLRPDLASDNEFLGMFLDEARLAARLNHPNVVQTTEVGATDERHFIAMEYLEGQPLNRVLQRLHRELPLGQHLRVLCEVLRGLHYAHELADYDGSALEVVHRDMSPHNVFVTYDGQVKVVDFGIAKALDSSNETRAGVIKGKVAYMAPEQARGDRVDRRADVYSVGVMLWEALAKKRLWKGQSDVVVLGHLLSGTATPLPSSQGADVAPELEAVCKKAIDPDVNSRYLSAFEFGRALERALETLGLSGTVREAGELVASRFVDERKRIRGIVDAQMKAARMLPTGEYERVELPIVARERTSSSGSLSSVPRPKADSLPAAEGATSTKLPVVGSGQTGSDTLPAETMAAITSPAPRTSRARPLAFGVVALGIGAAVAVAFVALRGHGSAAASSTGVSDSGVHDATTAAPSTTAGTSVAGTTAAPSGTASASSITSEASSAPSASSSASAGASASASAVAAQRPTGPAASVARSARPQNPGDPDMGF